MKRVQLFYRDISEIIGSGGCSVARLVDSDEQRAISIICDKVMTEQMAIRYNRQPAREQMLPEVLLSMLQAEGKGRLELLITDILDGQYFVTLIDTLNYVVRRIRMSDALLLHYIAQVPIYIEDGLMDRQSSPYHSNTQGISIPINALDTVRLNKELQRAITEEDYRLASLLHQEIQRRNKT